MGRRKGRETSVDRIPENFLKERKDREKVSVGKFQPVCNPSTWEAMKYRQQLEQGGTRMALSQMYELCCLWV